MEIGKAKISMKPPRARRGDGGGGGGGGVSGGSVGETRVAASESIDVM